MNTTYRNAAYRRTILSRLQQIVREQFVDGERPTQLFCEEVFYAERVVPEQAFLEVITLLESLEETQKAVMDRYEMVEKADGKRARQSEAGENSQPKPGRGKGRDL